MREALILFAHGARDPAWANPLRQVEASVRRMAGGNLHVALAFMDFIAPNLLDTVNAAIAQGAQRIRIVPLFIAHGGHLQNDLPKLIADLQTQWPAIEFKLARAIGEEERVIAAMAEAALQD
jgi:sirohydrochlorin cobaltochelatase